MSHTLLRPFIVKVSVIGYFPLDSLNSLNSLHVFPIGTTIVDSLLI